VAVLVVQATTVQVKAQNQAAAVLSFCDTQTHSI
jgi:hypothetical protein